MQTANPDLSLFRVDRDSTSYAIGYDHGRTGREFRYPDDNNRLGMADYRAGFAAGDDERVAAYDFPWA